MFGLVAVVGVVGLVGFFLSGGDSLFEGDKAAQQAAPSEPVMSFDLAGKYVGTEGGPALPAPPPDPLADLSAEQRYVAELDKRGRIRLAARAQIGGKDVAVVEWLDSSGIVQESLPVEALRALGYTVSFEVYGLRLEAGKHTIVATAWPAPKSVREADHRLYNLSPQAGPAGEVASAASHLVGGTTRPGSVLITFDEEPAGGS